MAHLKEFEHLKINLEAIKLATNNFADDNCIGSGGFGQVYKGEIAHSKGYGLVALKRLNRAFGQGDPEFWKEIMMLSLCKHENIISLIGYCDEYDEKILVYEYTPKKSLERYLNTSELSWVGRLKICIAAAHGLAYLHSADGSKQRVLHRDVKSSNILLDNNWNAKILDFGLSKFGLANQKFSLVFSNVVGTPGYCDPLYAETGFLTKESDVYSFGVVLFEVLCGRLCFHHNDGKFSSFTEMARQSCEQNKINEIIHGNIKDEINPNSLQVFTKIAYQCLKRDREERPLMNDVVRELENALLCQEFGGGFLVVTIHEGHDLKGKHPSILLRVGPDIRRTTTVKNNPNPVWKETFKFNFEKAPTNARLYLVVYSNSWTEKYLYKTVTWGDIYISLADVVIEKKIDRVFNLQDGRIHVELQWEPSLLPVKTKSKTLQFVDSFWNLTVKGVRGE